MQINQALFAEAANVRGDGRVDLRGLTAEIHAPAFPATTSGILLLLLAIEPGEPGASLLVRVRLRDVRDGSEVAAREDVMRIPAAMRPTRAGQAFAFEVRLKELVLPRPSLYELVVDIEGEEAAHVPLRAFQVDADRDRLH